MDLSRTASGVLFLALAAFLGCSTPARIEIKPKEVVLRDAGATRILNVTVFDQKDRPMEKAKLAFSSSAPDVAAVDGEGKVSAVSSGEATVTVTAGKASASVPVRVQIASLLDLTLPEGGFVGPKDSLHPLSLRAFNDRGEPMDLSSLSFTSSDPAVAALDGAGNLRIAGTGRVKITVSSGKTAVEKEVDVVLESPAAVKVETGSQVVPLGEAVPLAFTVISDQGRPMKVPVEAQAVPEGIVSVDGEGVARGLARGTATVTISAGPARNTLKVTVR
ncbi:MAG: Ig-like domain-containing protein [Acidobacteriota bacterium]